MSGRAESKNVIPGQFALSVGRPPLAIPEHWTWARLQDMARLGTGHTPSRKVPEYWGGEIPWIGIKDARLNHGGIIQETLERVTQAGLDNSAARLLPAGTVCLSRTASVGYVLIMGRNMATSQDFVNWACDEGLNPRFLMHLLLAEQASLPRFGKGTTHTTIYFPEVKAFHIALPPQNEQRRIVAKIEALQERSRKARTVLEAIPPLLENFRRSVLAAAFRGDLTANWRASHPDVEPASVLLERILVERRRRWEEVELAKMAAKGKTPKSDKWKSKYKEPIAPDVEELPELPDGWCWAAAEQIVEPGADIVYGIVQPGKNVPDGIPYVRGTDIQNRQILSDQLLRTSHEIHERYARSVLRSGDILLGIIRATKVAVVPDELDGINMSRTTARFRPSRGIRSYYLASWLDSAWAQDWLHSNYRGIDMPGLNLSKIRRLPVPLAPFLEQDSIGARVEDLLHRLQRYTLVQETAIDLVGKLDTTILQSAFQGKLVPQDPNDEPASVLLERIRKAREAEPPKKKRRKTKR